MKPSRTILSCLLPILLVSCDQSQQEQKDQIEALVAQVTVLAESIHQLKGQQSELLSEVRKSELSRQGGHAAMDLINKDILIRLDALSAETARISEQSGKVFEWTRAEPEDFEIFLVDLDNVGREISERILAIKQKTSTATEEQRKQLATLSRRKRDLGTLLMPEIRDRDRGGDYFRQKKDEELTEEEKKLASTIRAEIEELETEVGHLVPAPASSLAGIDPAKSYIRKKYRDAPVVILNEGFHGGQDRIIQVPEKKQVINITTSVIQEIDRLEDEDELFRSTTSP